MSFADPNELPPVTPPEPPECESKTLADLIGYTIVHGGIQFVMAFWCRWFSSVLIGNPPNMWLIWLAFTIIFVSLYWYDEYFGAEIVLFQFGWFCFFSIFAFIISIL